MIPWKERAMVYLVLAVMLFITSQKRTTINVYDCQGGQQQGVIQ